MNTSKVKNVFSLDSKVTKCEPTEKYLGSADSNIEIYKERLEILKTFHLNSRGLCKFGKYFDVM